MGQQARPCGAPGRPVSPHRTEAEPSGQAALSGLLIAAPSSGAGKTTVTLGLLRALRRRGIAVRSAKAGPDYIDPAFHAAASGAPCVNLDPWAMRMDLLRWLAEQARREGDGFVVEAMMGLFDGAADGTGSAADLAVALELTVVLVVDCAKQSHSVAALVRGFATHRSDCAIGGVILNRVGSERHANLLTDALAPLGIPVLGVLERHADLALPERHLGLVQAGERADLAAFCDRAGERVEAGCDVTELGRLAGTGMGRPAGTGVGRPAGTGMGRPAGARERRQDEAGGGIEGRWQPEGEAAAAACARAGPLALSPPGQRIAIARDIAFAFAYPHLLAGWQAAGVELGFFSPLADEAPDALADAVFLPGGYPELHAATLAGAANFRQGMRAAARRGAAIYGECGGYMVLGDSLEDGDGTTHAMLGLLPLATSFRDRRLHLGYRRVKPLRLQSSGRGGTDGSAAGPSASAGGWSWPGALRAHEFHYATILAEGPGEALFNATDALGADLGVFGQRRGSVCGSFLHLIDREA